MKPTYNDDLRENERLIGGEEAEYAKSCHRQLLAALLASLMALSSGTVIAGWSYTNGRRDADDKDMAMWSTEQESWIVSMYVFGALIGALPAGFMSQKFGRKTFLLWLAAPMVAGLILCMLRLDSLWLECLGRFSSGLSVGATTVAVPLYASEVSADIMRGRSGVFLDLMLCAGILYAYVARVVVTGLRMFCLASSLVPLTFVALFAFMPESPVHLVNVGRDESAAVALRWLRGSRFNVEKEIERIKISQIIQAEQSTGLSDKMIAENRRYLVRVSIVTFGLVLVQRLSGAGGVIQYSATLFQLSGIPFNANVACILVGAFQLAGSGASLLLVDRVGRRTLLLVSSATVTVCIALLIIYFRLLATGSLVGSPWKLSILFVLCVFISGFRLGLGPIPWFISTELMPAENRGGRVQSAAVSFSWALSFVIIKMFKMFVEDSPVVLWCMFGAFSAAGFAFVLYYVPETNSKSREQIRRDLTKLF